MPLSRLLAPALLVLALPVAHAQTSVHLGLRLGLNAATRSGENPSYQLTNSNGFPYPSTVENYRRKMLLAPQFGAVAEIRFGRLAVQPAILFSQKGVDQHLNITGNGSGNSNFTDNSSEEYHTISRPNYLEVPLNIVFTHGGDHGFQVFGGPYVAFGLGGRAEYEALGASSSTGYGGSYYYGNFWEYGNTAILYKDDYPGPPASFLQGNPSSIQYKVGATPFAASSGYAVARRFDAGLNVGVGYRQGPLQVQLGYGLGLVNQQPNKSTMQRDDLPAYYQRVAQLTATYFLKVK